MKMQYIVLGKEFKNKSNTVSALQRNFQVLSKLCQSEQEEKQKILAQSQQFKKELDEKVDLVCKLFEEIEEHKSTIADMKGKVGKADRATFEIQKMKDLMDKEKRLKEDADRTAQNLER